MATELSTLMGTLTDAVNNLAKKQSAILTLSASGQAWVGARRLKKMTVLASSSGVVRIRNGGSSGTIVFGDPSGQSISAGVPPYEFDEAYCGSGVYFEIVSGTCTVLLTSEPA